MRPLSRPESVEGGLVAFVSSAFLGCPGEKKPTESGRHVGELRFRLHHFAQWLAYEREAADPVMIT